MDFPNLITVAYPVQMSIPGVIGESGSVHFWEDKLLFPNGILRCFWITGVAEGVSRGSHAHWQESQVILAVNGSVEVRVVSVDGKVHHFVLSDPSQAVYVPPLNWVEVHCSTGAVVLGLSDREFSEEDYIRDKAYFEKLRENIR